MTDLVQFGQDTIEAGSKSFALASRVLSPGARDDAVKLYAYCRYADDLVDGQIMGHDQIADYKAGQAARVKQLRTETEAALASGRSHNPYLQSLVEVVRAHAMPERHVHELIDGFQMDADDRVYVSVGDTVDYGYHVAGVVGVMMAWLMGVRDAPTLDRASDLGIAFQLTNIARDVIEDARAGRVFVPQDLLRAHGAPVEAHALARRENWASAYSATVALLDVAEPYYASAHHGIAKLSFRDGWAILTALKVYRDIGEKLRAEGAEAWAGRVHTSKWRKIGLASAAMTPAFLRRRLRPVPRGPLYVRP